MMLVTKSCKPWNSNGSNGSREKKSESNMEKDCGKNEFGGNQWCLSTGVKVPICFQSFFFDSSFLLSLRYKLEFIKL
jgi:hypothetical protein